MSFLEILYYPDKRLRKIALLVKEVNSEVQFLIKDMFKIMYQKKGIGLAATQVNVNKQIIVINILKKCSNELVLINPVITEHSGLIKIKEGCLSIPNHYYFIPRAEKVKVKALNFLGKEFEFEAKDLLSVCIQHEIDHLNGKLFIDYLSRLKIQRINKKINKLFKFKKNKY